ncbi:hypothetical protein [Streptomyces sp. MMG1121]|nr:hypothetical protein [Streptomyces sp. MMG1121]
MKAGTARPAQQLEVVRAKLDPLRGRLVGLVDRGWLRKPPDGRFTICL